MNKAVFLDRDGIINRAIIEKGKPYPPLRISKVYSIEGIKEVIEKIHEKGYLAIVVTNQPDVANHLVDKRTVDKINEYLKSIVKFDDVFTCYHNEKDNCDCRKPKVGLFIKAKGLYQIDFSKSFVVGDRWKDIEAGKNIGCKTIFVDYGYNEKRPKNPSYVIKNVTEISDILEEI